MSLEIDHVVFCVESVAEAGANLEMQHGLVSVLGGRHEGHGTANRIVPLGSSYLELVEVAEIGEVASSSFGRWVENNASQILTPHALCLRTEDLGEVSERLSLESVSMQRRRADGTRLRWRVAGLESTITDGLPFFIEWDIPPLHHPGNTSLVEESQPMSIEVALRGDVAVLTKWTEGSRGVSTQPGDPGVASVVITAGDRVISL